MITEIEAMNWGTTKTRNIHTVIYTKIHTSTKYLVQYLQFFNNTIYTPYSLLHSLIVQQQSNF